MSSPRLDRHAYFATGFDLLAQRGAASLTITALCHRLRVSRGSFYHHFTDLPTYTDALIQEWEDDVTRELAVIESHTDPHARYEAAARYALTRIRHEVEAALRAWAFGNHVADAAVHRVDEAREISCRDTLGLVLDDPERCALLARMASDLLFGLQQARPMDPEMYLRIGLEWSRTNIGITVQATRRPDGTLAVRVERPVRAPT